MLFYRNKYKNRACPSLTKKKSSAFPVSFPKLSKEIWMHSFISQTSLFALGSHQYHYSRGFCAFPSILWVSQARPGIIDRSHSGGTFQTESRAERWVQTSCSTPWNDIRTRSTSYLRTGHWFLSETIGRVGFLMGKAELNQISTETNRKKKASGTFSVDFRPVNPFLTHQLVH